MRIRKAVEEAYEWIMDQEDYPTLAEFYEHYGFQDGQILFWVLTVKLGWIFRGAGDELMSCRTDDNPKLQKLIDESVRIS